MESYRAIYLGDDKWAVRRFIGGVCEEAQIILHVDNPQLRSSDKQAINAAIANGKWERVA